MTLIVRPIAFTEAAEYVKRYHRHNKKPVGHIFSTACYSDLDLVGVAICGRPVGRKLDDGDTLEIYRVCTNGTRNACSKLYSDAVKRARFRGYKRVITYTLQSETGASVKAANFKLDAEKAGGIAWNGRTKFEGIREFKRRWIYNIFQRPGSD